MHTEKLLQARKSIKKKTLFWLHASKFSSAMFFSGGLSDKITQIAPEYRILAIDLRGCGNSTYVSKLSSFKDFADDVEQVRKALGINRIVCMGTCLGGFVTMTYSIHYPQNLDGIILNGAIGIHGVPQLFAKDKVYPYKLEDSIHTHIVESYLDAVKKDDNEFFIEHINWIHPKTCTTSVGFPLVLQEYKKAKCAVELYWLEALLNISHDDNGKVKGDGEVDKMKTRALIIHGTADHAILFSEAESLKKIMGDLAILIPIQDAHHYTWYDDLNATCDPIKGFLESL